MSSKFKITIDDGREFTGRLIGFIDENECRAILNVQGSARKIFSASGLDLVDIPYSNSTDKRFVIATSDFPKYERHIFISPVIKYSTYNGGKRDFKCKDGLVYSLNKIWKS